MISADLTLYTLYLIASFIILFWCIVWVLHISALINGKRKLHKGPRQRQQRHLHRTSHLHESSQRSIQQSHAFKQSEPSLCSWNDPLRDNSDKSFGPGFFHSNLAQFHTQSQAQTRAAAASYQKCTDSPIECQPLSTATSPADLTCKPRDDCCCIVDGTKLTSEQQQQQQQQQEKHNHSDLSNDTYSTNKSEEQALIRIDIELPGVSIIKPLVGIDMNLHDNLETFFTMAYGRYELLFCVQDETDAAIGIVYKLMARYSHIDAKLFITSGDCVIIYDSGQQQQICRAATWKRCVNPKINNMLPAYQACKYELLLVSDSSIKMNEDTLLDMVEHMSDNVALVHQMPYVCDRAGFSALIEKVYFGTAHARAYLAADILGINCPTGMSALMRKFLLDEVGGIAAFGCYLAEDYFFAKSFTDRGWKISISSQPAWQNAAPRQYNPFLSDCFASVPYDRNYQLQQQRAYYYEDMNVFNQRISRWIKLRFAMVPLFTILEPISECMLLGLLAASSISFVINSTQQSYVVDPVSIYVCHVLVWFLFDYLLLYIVQNGPLNFSKTDYVCAWLIRECSALVVYIRALRDQNIWWRSRVFRLKWGGYAQEITGDLGTTQSGGSSKLHNVQKRTLGRTKPRNSRHEYSASI